MGFKRKRVEPADDYPGILNRQRARAVMEAKMGPAFDMLFLELKWGLGLFERTVHSSPDTLLADAAANLFWLYLEALDATDHLVSHGAIGPANVHARTLLEVGWQLLYLLKRNEEQVAAAYTAHYLRRLLADNERFVMGSEKRKKLEAWAKRTKYIPPDFLNRYPDTSAAVDEILKTLNEPECQEANEELDRLGADRWFKAFNGPSNVLELAREVGMELWHWSTYRRQSQAVHGSSPHKMFILEDEKRMKVRPLRDCEDWDILVMTCHVLNVDVCWAVIDRFRDGERPAFGRWYEEVIEPRLEGSPLKSQVDKFENE